MARSSKVIFFFQALSASSAVKYLQVSGLTRQKTNVKFQSKRGIPIELRREYGYDETR